MEPQSNFDTDSDSDGSHISATPPRDPPPPTPIRPPGPKPQPRPHVMSPTLLSSLKCKTRVSKPSRPNPKSLSKPTKRPPETSTGFPHKSSRQDLIPRNKPLPFQIRRMSDQNASSSASNPIETLPAGYFSKFASFSKIKRPLVIPDSVHQEPVLPEFRVSDDLSCESVPLDSISLEIRNEGVSNSVISSKPVLRRPNLIGACVNTQPTKRPKCVNEGNFVRLNINGHGRRFTYKGRGSNQSKYRGQKSYRRSRRKFKKECENDDNGYIEEDGLVSEAPKLEEPKGKKIKLDYESIEKAILAAREEASEENLARLLKLVYGYDAFRVGQLEAIKMVLDGKSTMLVLPTGAGKSLCYQLPAMILSGITLVVCPLVALMVDQLQQLPPTIRGGLLSSTQTIDETAETLRLLQEGNLKVLFVSPERFLNVEFLSILSAIPVISLLVVDEAHCVSEWSHNFRPSYMRLRASLLCSRLKIGSVLAMTATATTRTLQAVISALEIPESNLIRRAPLRDNLQLSVSLSGNRPKDLVTLIKSFPFSEVQSIIIYCKFQSDTDSVSKYLCDNNILAKSYHSGIPAKDRSRTQELFTSNKIRAVVATVAFGMGLDKRDVGAVIHYSLPESLEEYVQEIGRAGRDGRLSYCHLYFDDAIYFRLRSLMHSDGVDEYAVNKFLCQVFCRDLNLPGKICSLVKESAARKFDIKEEVMLTILTQLEIGDVQYLQLLPQLNATCTLNFHKTPSLLLADRDKVVGAILKESETKQGQYVFDIPTVANTVGATATDVSKRLQDLKVKGEISYELKDQAYCYVLMDVPRDICSLASHLTTWLSEVESCKVRRLDTMFNAAAFAVKYCEKAHGCYKEQHTSCLKEKISQYFNGDGNSDGLHKTDQSSPFLRSDIKVFLQSNSQIKFTPRAVARIMHGISSPAYPSSTWSRTHFWGRYSQIDFQTVMEAAKAELMNIVGKEAL